MSATDLIRAIAYATRQHGRQLRGGLKQLPYIYHPISVVNRLMDVHIGVEGPILVAAALHDVVEDCCGPDATAQTHENKLKEIKFQRPTLKYLWISIKITPGEKFPAVGNPEAAIAAAVALWGDLNISIGDDVERFALGTPINVVPGVKEAIVELGYTLNELDPQPLLSPADLVNTSIELALFDSSRILVTQ